VDTAGSVASVLAAGRSVEAVRFTLELGSEAVIGAFRYTLLGAMRRSVDESTWSEYLLYSPGRKFIWLIETDEGWQRSEVLDAWPGWDGTGHLVLENLSFNKSTEYSARVQFAVGSFNWRVKVGDGVRVTEFTGGPKRLAAEVSSEEMTWSLSSTVPLDQVRAWFGMHVHSEKVPHPGYRAMAKRIVYPLWIVNAIPLFLGGGIVFVYMLFASLAIYLPAYFLDSAEDRKS
jgi:hypothetical protein